MKTALIIFIKNPELGKAKTRIARVLGAEVALKVYLRLTDAAHVLSKSIAVNRYLFYADHINHSDQWESEYFFKELQDKDPDLGQKMYAAFMRLHEKGYEKVFIIGSDCPELSTEILEKGINDLSENEVIIGPALDGGYYLIGFNFAKLAADTTNTLQSVFLNKTWSHEQVLHDALSSLQGRSISLLPELSDVDLPEDLERLNWSF